MLTLLFYLALKAEPLHLVLYRDGDELLAERSVSAVCFAATQRLPRGADLLLLIHEPTRLLGLQHPIKADDLCAWDEEIIRRITHIP